MSILRNKLKDNFTMTPNAIVTDNRLSMGAKVVYIYLASKPDGWKVWNGEIQQSLNIKDSGTIAKYWKELLDTGWLERTPNKGDDGKFSGGYSYELMILPNTDNDQIGVKPESGKTPCYNNTDLSSNTNINKNTNNISNSNTLDKPNNQLFRTENKPKKKGENKFVSIVQELCSNQLVRDALLKYLNFRRQRGLTADQWELMVSKFKQDSDGKTVQQIVDCITQCTINGRHSLYYTEYDNQTVKNKPVQDFYTQKPEQPSNYKYRDEFDLCYEPLYKNVDSPE